MLMRDMQGGASPSETEMKARNENITFDIFLIFVGNKKNICISNDL